MIISLIAIRIIICRPGPSDDYDDYHLILDLDDNGEGDGLAGDNLSLIKDSNSCQN